MRYNYVFDDINQALPVMMGALNQADQFGSRAGLTKELMHVGITLAHPWRRELVLESRKANVAAQIVETMWVLAGRNDVRTLEPYLPRVAGFSDDGCTWRSGYGPRLRDFNGVDQLAYVVDTLKANPHSRQAVINLWDPRVDTTPGKDVACNNWLSFSSRNGVLDLHVAIRSNDAMWGWSGINAFEWSVLQEVVAGMTGLKIGALHFSTTSFHLYQQHWPKASRIANDHTWNSATMGDSPAFSWVDDMGQFNLLVKLWFEMEERIRTGQPVDVRLFPEPMMRSWLQVLEWYWSGDERKMALLDGTRLRWAALVGMPPAGEPQEPKVVDESVDPFLDAVNRLHADKHAAYGDSWKRRGEAGILANIARKVDRIDTGLDTSDETQADTAIDLLVYLAKYRCWLTGRPGDPADVKTVLANVGHYDGPDTYFAKDLVVLEGPLTAQERLTMVDWMLGQAMYLARSLWQG